MSFHYAVCIALLEVTAEEIKYMEMLEDGFAFKKVEQNMNFKTVVSCLSCATRWHEPVFKRMGPRDLKRCSLTSESKKRQIRYPVSRAHTYTTFRMPVIQTLQEKIFVQFSFAWFFSLTQCPSGLFRSSHPSSDTGALSHSKNNLFSSHWAKWWA